MPDALAVISRVIAEHHAISKRVKLAGDTVNDIEALFTLQTAQAGWTQSSITSLIEIQSQMQQTINYLEHGLNNHFRFEEEALPPLFGELLMKAILQAHRNIRGQIEGAKTAIAIKLEELDQQELLSKKSEIQQTINRLSQAFEEHASHEEVILNMIKKALEENKT